MAAFEGNIKQIRLKKGLSQEELAYRIGVSLSTLQRWEQNSRRPSRLALKALDEGAADLDGKGTAPVTTVTPAFEGDVRAIRLKLGWTRQRLAHEVGVSQSTLQRWEHRQTRPSGLAARQLARIVEQAGA
jgi:DNA-binding transcriptional regulator YiaG